jgi:alpha-mannosidase II
MPDAPARSFAPEARPKIRIQKGPLMDEVHVIQGAVIHVARLFHSEHAYAAALDITNLVDLRAMDNRELVMRVQSSVKNGKEFYSDLNGFQMRRRLTREKGTLQLNSNYFPMPSMAFLEDNDVRLSLHTHSACGVAGLEEVEALGTHLLAFFIAWEAPAVAPP